MAYSRRTSSGTYSGPSVGSGCVHSSTHSRRGLEKHVQARRAHNAHVRATTRPRSAHTVLSSMWLQPARRRRRGLT
eukprot:scaffold40091_cov60-Phaeocystis_antarctica.AAC.5